MQVWKKLGYTEQKVGYRTIQIKTFRLPDQTIKEYTVLNRIGAKNVAVIALTKKNQVVVARQFRPGPEKVLDELPGGLVEANEHPKMAAVRELREETGYTTNESLELLGKGRHGCYTNAVNYYYLARNCYADGNQQLDDSEFIEVRLISIERLLDNALKDKMTDQAAVLLALEKLSAIQGSNGESN